MLKILVSIIVLNFSLAFGVTLKDLKNNKESFSRILTKKYNSRISYWLNNHHLSKAEILNASSITLEASINDFNKMGNWCEISFIEKMKNEAIRSNVIRDRGEFDLFLGYLRTQNMIDDLLLNILVTYSDLEEKFWNIKNENYSLNYTATSSDPLQKIYLDFNSFLKEDKKCFQDIYSELVQKIQDSFKRNDSKFLGRLHYQAFSKKVISEKKYYELETLRFGQIVDLDFSLKTYIKNLNTVKDKLTTSPEERNETTFSETYVYRRSNLTRRGKLYTEYSNTQILLMSQLIEKTAKRIDAKEVHLYFRYDDENLENETYVFSPMEQYRIAVKMLRKDMAELRRSEIFKNTPVYYEDIIAAAFETGAITSKELDYVLKFDDLWNPKISKWRGIASFSLSIAGTGTFLLPTPFNYIGAIALIFTQSRLAGGQKTENPEDNENVII